MKKILTWILLGSLFIACSGNKNAVNNNTEKTKDQAELEYVIIGEGGGFTGMYEQYKVLANGKVFVWDGKTETTTALGALTQERASKYFSQLRSLNFEGNAISKPGNMNYSINYVGPEKAATILWSDNNAPQIEVLTLYKELMNDIRLLK